MIGHRCKFTPTNGKIATKTQDATQMNNTWMWDYNTVTVLHNICIKPVDYK